MPVVVRLAAYSLPEEPARLPCACLQVAAGCVIARLMLRYLAHGAARVQLGDAEKLSQAKSSGIAFGQGSLQHASCSSRRPRRKGELGSARRWHRAWVLTCEALLGTADAAVACMLCGCNPAWTGSF